MQPGLTHNLIDNAAGHAALAVAVVTHEDGELTQGPGQHELERDVALVQGYVQPWWKLLLFGIAGTLSGGLLWLACLWSLSLRVKLTMSPSASIAAATYVYVQLRDHRSAICKVYTIPSALPKAPTVRYFVFHTVRFIFSSSYQTFIAVPATAATLSQELLAARQAVGNGLTPNSPQPLARHRRELQYGENLLLVDSPSFWKVFAHDALQPFVCFQYLSVVIWCLEAYYTYSVIVFVITMTSVVINSVSQYSERKRMAELAHYVCEVELLGGTPSSIDATVTQAHAHGVSTGTGPNGYPLVPSSSLVPGDVVVVSTGKMAFDGVLLEGECVMDETVLTGESVPVRKTAYDPDLDGSQYNQDTFNHCTLFNGTVVSAVRSGRAGRPALAMVVSTGFNTAKGRLLRTIMYPRSHNLQFIKQAMYFIGMMFIMAMAFYIWDVVALVRLRVSAGKIVLKAFDMITTAVPPALAACLAIATTISVMRLRGKQVYVLDAERVAMAGLLDAICFDKTGTLTESGLEFGGVVPVQHARFLSDEGNPQLAGLDIQMLFAACHGLTQLGDTVVGDPLDQRLFEASGFEMRFEEELPAAMAQPAAFDAAQDGQGGPSAPQAAVGPYLVVRKPVAAATQDQPRSYGVMARASSNTYSQHMAPGTQQLRQISGSSSSPHALLAGQPQLSHLAPANSLTLPATSLDVATPNPLSNNAPASIGHGQGVFGALSRFSSRHSGDGGSLTRRLSLELGLARLSGREGEAASPAKHIVGATEHATATDPYHKPIHMAGQRFNPHDAIYVLRRFDFSSERLRSSAVVLQPDGRVMVLTKGSPEKLLQLMDPASVPPDFSHLLQSYTNRGLRVIAIASRQVTGLSHPSEVLRMSQDQLEAGTQLLGLVLMVNKLKPESEPSIQSLQRACIRTAMITGDHVRTAVTVARQCAIMNGNTPAMIIDVDKGSLWDAKFTCDVIPGETGQLPTSWSPATSFTAPASDGNPQTQRTLAQALIAQVELTTSLQDGTTASDASPFAAGAKQSAAKAGCSLQQALRCAAAGEVQVALTGRAWQKANADSEKHADVLEVMLQRGTVFARMNPEDKRSLVEQLGFGEVDAQGRIRPGCGFYTGYCGDGANDLGALKGALVGVSLCDAEASIAAPMTSRIPHIGVMISVVAEGRCAMVTSLIIFKYTMVYAYIQVLALALLYNLGLTVGNYQYLIQDMFHTTLLASCMALTGPASTLGRERPLARVLSAGVIMPVIAQMFIDTLMQLTALWALYRQDWYVRFEPASRDDVISVSTSEHAVENSVLFIISTWQLIINALVFNVGRPFRRGLWTNPWLVASLVCLTAFNVYILWAPGDPFKRKAPAVVDMPTSFKGYLTLIIASNLLLAYVADWASKWLYRLCKDYYDRRRGGSLAQRRMKLAAVGLAPKAPSVELQTQVTGAVSNLLPAHEPRSSSKPDPS